MTEIGLTQTASHFANAREALAALRARHREEGPDGLTEDERRQVQELRKTDREVRAHEQAHARAGGPYAGSPTYEYVRGPDGRRYAVSGEVQIDTSPIPGNPAATIRKMETVIRAAQAPAEPSAQDRKVAAEARAKKVEAQIELQQEKEEQRQGAQPWPLEQARNPDAAARSYAATLYQGRGAETGLALSLAA